MREQIEEMCKLCPFYEEGKCNLLEDEAAECNFDCDMCDFARTLYNAGYRKQSENTVELPCKVGQTVYMPWEWGGTKGVAILTINRIVFDFTHRPYVNTNFFSDDEEYWLAYNCGRFNFTDFGETVFLTKEEAEKALEKMKGGAE